MHVDAAQVKKSVRTYLMIGAALLAFTVITVGANLVHLAVPIAIAVALTIASVKASMVAAVFMHLNHEKRWIYGSLLLTAVFFLVLILVPLLTTSDTYGTKLQTPAAHEAATDQPGR